MRVRPVVVPLIAVAVLATAVPSAGDVLCRDHARSLSVSDKETPWTIAYRWYDVQGNATAHEIKALLFLHGPNSDLVGQNPDRLRLKQGEISVVCLPPKLSGNAWSAVRRETPKTGPVPSEASAMGADDPEPAPQPPPKPPESTPPNPPPPAGSANPELVPPPPPDEPRKSPVDAPEKPASRWLAEHFGYRGFGLAGAAGFEIAVLPYARDNYIAEVGIAALEGRVLFGALELSFGLEGGAGHHPANYNFLEGEQTAVLIGPTLRLGVPLRVMESGATEIHLVPGVKTRFAYVFRDFKRDAFPASRDTIEQVVPTLGLFLRGDYSPSWWPRWTLSAGGGADLILVQAAAHGVHENLMIHLCAGVGHAF